MKFIMYIFFFFLTFQVWAIENNDLISLSSSVMNELQDQSVEGKVVDANGVPLAGASIVEKGTNNGVVADFDGNFKISVANNNSIIVVSYVGFATQEVTPDQGYIEVQLLEDAGQLDEVVVVGYGSQKAVNVIGSVESVSNKEITAAPVSSISNALAGRLPGAIVQQTSGEPGADAASILIRGRATLGNNNPLVVVDGVAGRDLNSINSDDVESISILKDASAAIYGAQAANGVILVTTKKGTKDEAPSVTYSTYAGILTPTALPEMASAATYAQMLREVESYRGIESANMTFSQDDVEKFASGAYPWTHPDTDWFGEVLRKNTETSDHNLSVSGGSKTTDYFLSFGSHYANGLYKNGIKKFNRYNINARVDVQVNKYLNLGINLRASEEKRYGPYQNSQTIFDVTNQNKPTAFAYYPNGLPGVGMHWVGLSPHVQATGAGGFDDDKRYRSDNTLTATFDIPGIEGLSLSSFYAYDIFFGKRKHFFKNAQAYFLDEQAYFAAGNTGAEDGSAFLKATALDQDPKLTNYYNDSKRSTFNFRINYEKSFGNHNLDAFIAYESMEYGEGGTSAFRRYFISNQLPYLFAGGNEDLNNNETAAIDARENYFGRLSYNYNETYLLEFTFRRDGSLRFSKDSGRWGNFPAVLAGWRVSNEDFWDVGFIDFLKLRASWAQMGNDLIDPFQYLASYEFGEGSVFGADRSYATGLFQSVAPNPSITWEVANVYNAGFDANLFNNKMNISLDAFYEKRNKILVQRNASVPQFTGISLPDENFGIVENRGIEAQLGFQDRSGDFSYGINGNFAFSRNKIVEFDEPARSVPWQRLTGRPQGSALLYKSIGIYNDVAEINSTPHVSSAIPGDVIIEDINGDGEITNDDRIYFPKTTIPEITYGVSFNFGYKNFDLSGLISGQGRVMVRMLGRQQGYPGGYFQYSAGGRWTPDNINATKPRAYNANDPYWRQSQITDMAFQDMDFARLKNLSLTYTIPSSGSIFLKEAQLFLSGENLFLIYQKEKAIWDPEFVGNRNNYPLMKVFSLGARISF